MQILKALVGGLIGGGVGAYASSAIQSMFARPVPWTLLLAGVCAGFGVRLLCGKDRNYMTGGIAALAAIVGLLGSSYVDSLRVLKTADEPQPVIVFDIEDDGAADEDEYVDEIEKAVPDTEEVADEAAGDVMPDEAEIDGSAPDELVIVEDEVGAEGDVEQVTIEDPADLLEVRRRPQTDPSHVDWSSLEVILHAVSALLAYLIGTGAAAASVVAGQTEQASDSAE